jgi:AraC-like DNA-binding protein
MAARLWKEARSILVRHAAIDRLTMSAMPGLHLMRFGWASMPLVSTQFPCMALVLQGVKSIEFAGKQSEYRAGQFMLASMDMPVSSRIVNASRTQPLLALAVDLDFAEMKEAMNRCDHLPAPAGHSALTIFDVGDDAALLEPVVRLLRLLDTPAHQKALAPLIRQELYYRLLTGPSTGSRLLDICREGSPSNRIAEATNWIRRNFAEGFLIDNLARNVGMSPSSLHQHFKVVTGMTPIQYQKRIRLQEARRGMLLESLDIGEASFRVGYHSHSQFTKDYRRYFGRLPKDDLAAHARNGAASITAYTRE